MSSVAAHWASSGNGRSTAPGACPWANSSGMRTSIKVAFGWAFRCGSTSATVICLISAAWDFARRVWGCAWTAVAGRAAQPTTVSNVARATAVAIGRMATSRNEGTVIF